MHPLGRAQIVHQRAEARQIGTLGGKAPPQSRQQGQKAVQIRALLRMTLPQSRPFARIVIRAMHPGHGAPPGTQITRIGASRRMNFKLYPWVSPASEVNS